MTTTVLQRTHEPLPGYCAHIPNDQALGDAIPLTTLLHAERSAALAAIDDLLKMDDVARQECEVLTKATLKLIRKSTRSFKLGATPEVNRRAFLGVLETCGGLRWRLEDLRTVEQDPVYLTRRELEAYRNAAMAALGNDRPFKVTHTP